jgi:hypothetical protein
MLDDSELVKHFPTLLKALKARIKALPASLPLASLEALLARYLGDLEIDAEEGARSSANRERTFQVSEDEQRKRITVGKYGMNLVRPFLEFYYTDRVGMLVHRIRDLNTILAQCELRSIFISLCSDLADPPRPRCQLLNFSL